MGQCAHKNTPSADGFNGTHLLALGDGVYRLFDLVEQLFGRWPLPINALAREAGVEHHGTDAAVCDAFAQRPAPPSPWSKRGWGKTVRAGRPTIQIAVLGHQLDVDTLRGWLDVCNLFRFVQALCAPQPPQEADVSRLAALRRPRKCVAWGGGGNRRTVRRREPRRPSATVLLPTEARSPDTKIIFGRASGVCPASTAACSIFKAK
jgi:hypothetical protein